MQSNRGVGTLPEMRLRSALHRLGYRYWINVAPVKEVRRTADIVFKRDRVAVFVDGCFWHSCPLHRSVPKTNVLFWTRKLERTVERDAETDRMLLAAGWTVVRVWEHVPLDEAVTTISNLLCSLRRDRTRLAANCPDKQPRTTPMMPAHPKGDAPAPDSIAGVAGAPKKRSPTERAAALSAS